jgi:glucose-1-phosphate thymidylyltransferase
MAGDNVLDFSLKGFVAFAREKGTSCVMCHEENRIEKQRKTAIITVYSIIKLENWLRCRLLNC